MDGAVGDVDAKDRAARSQLYRFLYRAMLVKTQIAEPPL